MICVYISERASSKIVVFLHFKYGIYVIWGGGGVGRTHIFSFHFGYIPWATILRTARLTQGARGVNLTWNAVKGCLVSTCLGHLPEHFLGGQPGRYAARNKWRPFSKWPPFKHYCDPISACITQRAFVFVSTAMFWGSKSPLKQFSND